MVLVLSEDAYYNKYHVILYGDNYAIIKYFIFNLNYYVNRHFKRNEKTILQKKKK